MKITFLGAVEEVTGSRYLIEHEYIKILIDCGMFQGCHEITRRNFEPFPVDPKSIDAIVLTHAHIDHSGYIPALVKQGFRGKIYCSQATYALCSLLLIDSGSLQEEEAKRINKRREGSDHPPVTVLYTKQDAENSLKFFQAIEYDTTIAIDHSLQVTLIRSGHILGSSFVVITDGKKKLTFSGDLGRPQQNILKPPPALTQTDFLVIESTYGDRIHEKNDVAKQLEDVVNATVAKHGILIIPCFAVERTEAVLYYLYQLQQKNAIPRIPIFLDSPLAIKVTDLLCDFNEEYVISRTLCKDISDIVIHTRTVEESKQLDELKEPAIIIAGNGMADGGRVIFHLRRFISDPKNTVLFVGFQTTGTEGHMLVAGAKEVKIFGELYTVKAEVKKIEGFSAHADSKEILLWLENFKNKPQKVFVTHGETEAARALKEAIEKRFGWSVVVPQFLDSFDMD